MRLVCYHPLKAYRSASLNEKGKRGITFKVSEGFADLPAIEIPCGQCVGCRLERSRQWAIRCQHEAALHAENCFITLTYNDENLPEDRSLSVEEFQKFMKRLRKQYGEGIRYYHCGEYGETFGRPHYHACIFNFDFPDKEVWKISRDHRLYVSPSLNKLWPFGYSIIGNVTFESAAYVARYILKKITGKQAKDHYEYIDPKTGEVFNRKPEYTTMSRRPGIAHDWLRKYLTDVYPCDNVVINNKKMRPPKYYDRQYEILSPDEYETLKNRREADIKKHRANNTKQRLAVREKIQLVKLKRLKRNHDEED